MNNISLDAIASSPTSKVGSIPLLYKSIFCSLVSNPMTLTSFEKEIAIGIPTYPKPINDKFSFLLTNFSYKLNILIPHTFNQLF